MNTPSSPASWKSSHGDEERRRLDPVVALRRHPGERAGEQRAAQAVADGVDLALAGRLLDRVERGEIALRHVVVEALLGEPLVRVDPADHEHGVALRHRPAHEAVLRPQVEDVELVDPGRHDQQRPLQHRLRGRRVLDQLHQVVLVDDLARRDGDVLAELERVHVGHLDAQLAAAALEVGEQVVEALAAGSRRRSRRSCAAPRGW